MGTKSIQTVLGRAGILLVVLMLSQGMRGQTGLPEPRESDDAKSARAPLPTAKGVVIEPARKVPVAYDVDVVVCGGGISGTMAALASARHGAKTLVIDRFGSLGGNMGPGKFGGGSIHYAIGTPAGGEFKDTLVNAMGLGGLPEEFLRRIIYARPNADQLTAAQKKELDDKHLNVEGLRVGTGGGLGYGMESVVVSHVIFQMMDEAKVELLLSAYVADPILEGNTVRGVFVETKTGRIAVRAKVVIDATGEADVACRAGAPVRYSQMPNLGVTYTLIGIDPGKYHGVPAPKPTDTFQLERKVGKATITIGFKEPKEGGLAFGRTGTVGEVDFSDYRQISLMEREHRMHIVEYARYLRKNVPGCENAYLLDIAPYLMARGGRTIVPEADIGAADLKEIRKFDDVIYHYYNDKGGTHCDIPYRMMLPKKIDGLLATGRSDMVYGPNFRQRYSVLLHAQAAGMAAALAVRDGVPPRKLEVRKLQKELVKVGCPIGDEARLKELGLK